jgi:hypothetical protein
MLFWPEQMDRDEELLHCLDQWRSPVDSRSDIFRAYSIEYATSLCLESLPTFYRI